LSRRSRLGSICGSPTRPAKSSSMRASLLAPPLRARTIRRASRRRCERPSRRRQRGPASAIVAGRRSDSRTRARERARRLGRDGARASGLVPGHHPSAAPARRLDQRHRRCERQVRRAYTTAPGRPARFARFPCRRRARIRRLLPRAYRRAPGYVHCARTVAVQPLEHRPRDSRRYRPRVGLAHVVADGDRDGRVDRDRARRRDAARAAHREPDRRACVRRAVGGRGNRLYAADRRRAGSERRRRRLRPGGRN